MPKKQTQSAFIVSVNFSKFGVEQKDQGETIALNQKHHADEAYKASKIKIDPDAVAPLKEHFRRVRRLLTENDVTEPLTLPYCGGCRLLPEGRHAEFVEAVEKARKKTEQILDEVVKPNWATHKAETKRRMNGSWDEGAFPTWEEFRSSFGIKYTIAPFDRDMSSVAKTYRDLYRDQIEQQVHQAEHFVVEQVMAPVMSMVNTLGDPDKTVKESLIENVKRIRDLLPSLNFDGNPEITAMITKLDHLAAMDIDQLRDDDAYRKAGASSAATVAKQLGKFGKRKMV